jgi:hypothetical protein
MQTSREAEALARINARLKESRECEIPEGAEFRVGEKLDIMILEATVKQINPHSLVVRPASGVYFVKGVPMKIAKMRGSDIILRPQKREA